MCPSLFSSDRRSIDVPPDGRCREYMCHGADPGKQTQRKPLCLPPCLLRQFRRHYVTSEVEQPTPPQTESLLRPSYAKQDTVVSSLLNHLHNGTTYFAKKHAISDEKKVEDNDARLTPFVYDDRFIDVNGDHMQSMESTPLQIRDDSVTGTSRVLDLGSRALDHSVGGISNNAITSERSPGEGDDQGSADNENDEITVPLSSRDSPMVEDLWGTLSASDERIPHNKYDCASTFCSDANSNEGSPIGTCEGMVNNAGRFAVSGGLSCSPVFVEMTRLNSQVESLRSLELNVGADLKQPRADASASNLDEK